MPAHTRDLPPPPLCNKCGWRKATVEVFDAQNGSLGPYCNQDGKALVMRLNKEIHTDDEPQRPHTA